MKKTLEIVADICGVTVEEIKSKTRREPVVAARHIVWEAMYSEAQNFCIVSRRFSVSHQTVMHGVARVRNAQQYDRTLAILVHKARKALQTTPPSAHLVAVLSQRA